ncbi:hypothetical protein PIB30_039956 [Stylosanthes scabra]|uniref:Uncharacterized protein n=1 Tax=Stylosanthes scabra TaxID=79078 RepID=A0ABU6TGI4_9FABA|nr:hypothetical protein [Stylosanthes scabra]
MEKNGECSYTIATHTLILVCTRRGERELCVAGDGAAIGASMARKGKEVAAAPTPSRSRTTKNSSRGRDEGFPAERFDSRIHHDRWRTMEHRGFTHERIIRFPDGESDFMREHIEGLVGGSCTMHFFQLTYPWCGNSVRTSYLLTKNKYSCEERGFLFLRIISADI